MTSALPLLKKPIDDLYELSKEKFKHQLDKWRGEKNLKELDKRINSVLKVKTIWQIDKEINLKKFYYPSKLIIDNEAKTISRIKKIPCETNIIIQGTVGQGKSIFLRYICAEELKSGARIPVFFELRKIIKGNTLKQYLITVLDSWGFEVDDELFNFFAESGKFVFLLDGFDELDPALVSPIIHELELLSKKYNELKIIITSRPDSGIERSAYFRTYQLAPLEPNDHAGILRKLVANVEQEINILKALDNSSTQIKELLTTPLMMTLLVFVYKSSQKIPEQFSEFYENLFHILISRHDNSKPGYVRAKNCPINERKLQELFEAFCFFASKAALVTMNENKIHELANNAILHTAIQCDSNSFIKDISKISCLVLQDGLDYHFIHKSVREYYAASYIKKRPDEFAIKFYQAMLQKNKWQEWNQELIFLLQIDEYRLTKYFLIPYMIEILKKFGIDYSIEYQDFTDIDLIDELKKTYIVLHKDKLSIMYFREFTNLFYYIYSLSGIILDLIFPLSINGILIKNRELINDKSIPSNLLPESLDISTIDLIKLLNLTKKVLKIINNGYRRLHSTYQERCQFVENEERKADILDF